MKHATDMVHPLLDNMAGEYYYNLPRELWASVGVDADLSDPRLLWWTDKPEIRAQFRELAIRFIDGDERLAIWRLKTESGAAAARA